MKDWPALSLVTSIHIFLITENVIYEINGYRMPDSEFILKCHLFLDNRVFSNIQPSAYLKNTHTFIAPTR
jgi:hypothetical protein